MDKTPEQQKAVGVNAKYTERAYAVEKMPAKKEAPEGKESFSLLIIKSDSRDAVNVAILRKLIKRKAVVSKLEIAAGDDYEVLSVEVIGFSRAFLGGGHEEMDFEHVALTEYEDLKTEGAFHHPVIIKKVDYSKAGIDYDKVYEWYSVPVGGVFPAGLTLFGAQLSFFLRAVQHYHFRFKEVIAGFYEFSEGSLDTLIALITYALGIEPYKKPDMNDLAG